MPAVNLWAFPDFCRHAALTPLTLQEADLFLAEAIGGDFRDEAGWRKELGAAVGGASAA